MQHDDLDDDVYDLVDDEERGRHRRHGDYDLNDDAHGRHGTQGRCTLGCDPGRMTEQRFGPADAARWIRVPERGDDKYSRGVLGMVTGSDEFPGAAVLDGLDRVIRIGSFSKTLSASVRCGYIAGRADWIEGLIDLQVATSFGG